MSEEKKNSNSEIMEAKKSKENSLIIELSLWIVALLIVIPITSAPYFYYKNKEWKSEKEKCWAYVNNGLYERAVEYADSIKDHYKIPSTYFCIGVACYNIGNLQLALENFKEAEEREESIIYGTIHGDDDLVNIYAYMTKVLCKMGKCTEAMEHYEKLHNVKNFLDIVSNDDDNNFNYRNEFAGIIKEIAKDCEEKGDIDNAIKYYQDALIYYCDRCHKEKSEIYKKLAELYEKKGDKTKAKKYLDKAIELE